jgi:hypothetical protein
MSTIGPIHASEIDTIRESLIPALVFEVFNKLIAKNFSGSRAIVRQDDVMELLTAGGLNRQEIYDNHWLDVEDSYRKVGWKVTYDKPDYTESAFEPYFTFQKN